MINNKKKKMIKINQNNKIIKFCNKDKKMKSNKLKIQN